MILKRLLRILIIALALLITLACQNEREEPEPPAPIVAGDIAYHYYPGTQNGVGSTYTINVDGSENRKLFSTTLAHNHHDWSPDGTRMAVQGYDPDSIYVLNIDGTQLTRLTTAAGVTDTEPAWSPDGQRIAFTRFHDTVSNSIESAELWIMNADGGDQQNIGINGAFANWSPDGTHLIYITKAADNLDIFTCLVDGTQIQRLTATSRNENAPIWSHNGEKIAFSAANESNGTEEIFIMNADGTGLVQLTHNACNDGVPRWSVDDSQILFSADLSAPDHFEVYLMNADGSNIRQVTHTQAPAISNMPVWRPRT